MALESRPGTLLLRGRAAFVVASVIVPLALSCGDGTPQTQDLIQQIAIDCNIRSEQITAIADCSYADVRVLDTELETPVLSMNLKFKFQHDGKHYRWKEVRIETLPWITREEFMKVLSTAQTGERLSEVIQKWLQEQ